MTDEHRNEYLFYIADEEMRHREPDIAYQILRELVWRSPYWRHEAWELLSKCAEACGNHEEAAKAQINSDLIKAQQDMHPFGDKGYRWDVNITHGMPDEARNESFLNSALEKIQLNELEVAYQILKELVWRSPCWRHEAWELLSQCATLCGQHEEAAKAKDNGIFLKKRQIN